MEFGVTALLISSALLLVDTLFSIYNFKYTYFLELKRRYAKQKHLPWRYKQKLDVELQYEDGLLRKLIQSAYIPWFVFCLLTHFWLLPIISSILVVLTNLIHPKPYISPMMLLLNLVTFFMIYLFPILVLIGRFV